MPRLVIKRGAGVGRDHTLGATECVVGRDPNADFVLDDASASRRHFRVYPDQGLYFMQDLGSTNGTRVNGRRAQTFQLADGDRIQAGASEVTFVQKDPFAGAPAKPRVIGHDKPAPTPSRKAGIQAPVPRRRRR